jgi:hypothetical protein
MSTLAARELLHLWDTGNGRDHTSRALLMLGAAGAETGEPDISGLTIGARDERLFDLRRRIFGSRIEALETCPRCQARLEIALDLADVRVSNQHQSGEIVTVDVDGLQVDVRVPTSEDLLAIRSARDLAQARNQLLARCVVRISGRVPVSDPANLPAPIQDAIARRLAEQDPQAEVLLALECADCGLTWQVHFDIVEYLWTEIDRACRRLLRDVHLLASAYGWTEETILGLPPRRRAIYLGMVVDG